MIANFLAAVSISTESVARACARHPWRTVGLWLLAVVVSMGIVAVLLGDTLTTEGEVTSATDSKRAEELLFEHFPPSPETAGAATSEVVVVSFDGGAVDEERVGALAAELREAGAATVVTSADEGRRAARLGRRERDRRARRLRASTRTAFRTWSRRCSASTTSKASRRR